MLVMLQADEKNMQYTSDVVQVIYQFTMRAHVMLSL